jgi:localization factor PodJL
MIRMTSGAPWSVKGIDPKTREIAKDLARRSGMTLGEWLTHVIAEDGGDEPAGEPPRKSADRPASENRTPRRGGEDLTRLVSALEELSARFEVSAQEQAETAARFERAISDLKVDQARVAERLQTAEHGGAATGKIETLRALEGALNKVAGHLAAGEGRHREAMVEMRRELGEEMSRVADEVNRKVLEVENRSADAIFQVGAEVTRVAAGVEQRLRRADDAQAEALEKLGGEIARITERLSDRIAAAERRSAQSVEDVGQQVARMADRMHERQARSETELAERIRQSEERTAKLLEEARQTIDRRLLRAGAPAAEEPPASNAFSLRWTPTGMPTAAALQVETPAAEAETPAFEAELAALDALATDHPEMAALHQSEPDYPEAGILAVDAGMGEEEGIEAEPVLESADHDLQTEYEEPYGDADEDDSPQRSIGYEAYAPSLTAEAGEDAQDDLQAMQAVADAIAFEALDVHEAVEEEGAVEEEPEEHDEALSASAEPQESLRPFTKEMFDRAPTPSYPAYADDEAEEEEDDGGMTFADLGARRPKQNHAMRGALLAGGAAAFMGLAGAGYVALHPEILHGLTLPAAHPIPVGPPSAPAPATGQQAAVALATAPTPLSSAPPTTALQATAAKPVGQDLESLYRDAATRVDAHDPSGVAPLRTAANLGYAPAQRLLGVLYEKGDAGVEKDPVEGRRWTVRAAANGDARGMHNLALDYYEGFGGPQSATVAAEWFQRAAELGVRDSQWNLARFFEAGIGVQRDLGAAYRWYLIAGRAGDTAAQARADSLKDKLSADQRTRAEAQASAFRPDPAPPPASLSASLGGANPKQLALAQRALAKLGYYKGPDDGAPSETLGEAIQSYQRERGLAANGQLSPELLQTFAHVSQ